jgi:phospholipid transport system transporter-binding protein
MNSAAPLLTAALPEQLTMHDAAQSLVQLRQALAQQPGPQVTLDAQALRVFDSSAVAVLLELRRGLLAQGKALRVCHIPQRLQDLVALYGVSALLPA